MTRSVRVRNAFAFPRTTSQWVNARADVALVAVRQQWTNMPSSWSSGDPCGQPWDGVTCESNGRVTRLKVLGITGQLVPDLWALTELTTLNLLGCSLSGSIPAELGSITGLSFLALNSNKLTGSIPATLGNLFQLQWFDISDNQLTGSLPVSTSSSPGLDLLVNTWHFHFSRNQLSGQVPAQLFSSNLTLKHILLDGNQFQGSIPSSIGLTNSLEIIRLDQNSFSGTVPANINDLTNLQELYLGYNQLSGPLPDLSGMNSLTYVDLSNNSFNPSIAPAWFSSLQSLSTLNIEYGSLQGTVPQSLFTLPLLQLVNLRNNHFNGSLNLGNNFSSVLQLVDLQNNNIIQEVTVSPGGYSNTLILLGNPYCSLPTANSNYCQQQNTVPYSTDLSMCGSRSCISNEQLIPVTCRCAVPLIGTFAFKAPSTIDLSNKTLFQELEQYLWKQLNLSANSVLLQNIHMNNTYLVMQIFLFPTQGTYFSLSDILAIGSYISNQNFSAPNGFGPYTFLQYSYSFPATATGSGGLSRAVVAGIACGSSVLVLVLVLLVLYALRQKRAERVTETSRPSEPSWKPSDMSEESDVPQIRGARRFSFEELSKCTGNFSTSNEIGHGGYGKVYRGIHPDGQILAIKRSQQGSIQGARQFKTEIELLSRVHHKNLVSLIGFCIEQGEQMLVYEFMVNGSLRESLSGRSGIRLDWKRRLRVALGSASGLVYLHELVSPPIIHRDVKSANILLDEKLTAKVADFGLSKLLTDDAKGHISTQVKGTMGYLDPEYYMTLRLTEKSDVYSFGVVMLELITSKQPIERGKYIVREVRTSLNRYDRMYFGLDNIMDPAIKNEERLVGFGKFLELALRCVEESSVDRPSMVEVTKVINEILQENEMHSDPTSITSSSTEFGVLKAASRHPYSDASLSNYSGSFDHIGKFEQK
ncbi:hypothetical protein MLD38_038333 [Melastoma candidum]|uniref:Uncharacterized protein n=1 Tax=Melastoma candidum TaxID=119954 RepID=A0ACB9KZT5_9MYRT|nr:hypothetical protein MLD38_038333 [Melastoma candidum]